jgi:hypothetical protein
MEQGWDSDVSAFFVRIVNAIAVTVIWMLTASTIGLYAELVGSLFTKRVEKETALTAVIGYDQPLVPEFF